MQASRVRIKQFRALTDVELDLTSTTIVIGENNAGKTSLLDSIRLALSHRWGLRGSGFDEYDFHLEPGLEDPKRNPGICIEIDFIETEEFPWTDDILVDTQSLGILQSKPDGTNLVMLRAEYYFDRGSSTYEATWCFLSLDGTPLKTPTSRAFNLYGTFFNYIPVFSLAAIRDAGVEFTSRSQFWGKLIQSIKVSEDDWITVYEELNKLNDQLIATDPKFAAIKNQLEEVKSVIPPGSVDSIDLRALPLRIWDLISKTELLLRTTKDDPPLPLDCFGQGVQSLAVVNIFRAFVDNLLQDEYEGDSEPILLMEEPESHLHPQAARAFYNELSAIPGQKIITTHSPYFLQCVPFEEIRLLRRSRGHVVPFSIRTEYQQKLEINDRLTALAKKYKGSWRIDTQASRLAIRGALSDVQYKELLGCYIAKQERKENHPRVKSLFAESKSHIDKKDLIYLQEAAKRIRGEIFFARKWLLVEGPSDFVFLTAAADILGYPFDSNGVAVVDCQLHGKAHLFAALARAFGFPWAALFDGDSAGDAIVSSISKQRFDSDFMKGAVRQFAKKENLELAVVTSVPNEIVDDILFNIGKHDGKSKLSNGTRAKLLANSKIEWSQAFQAKAKEGTILVDHIPKSVRDVVEYLKATEAYQ